MDSRVPLRTVALATAAIAVFGAFYAFAAAKPGMGNPTARPSTGNPIEGRKIFTAKCVACHKADGTGGIKLTGNPSPSWKDPRHVFDPKFNDDYLRDCITNGKMKSGMVAWGKTGQLKPAEIENVIAYIHTLMIRKK